MRRALPLWLVLATFGGACALADAEGCSVGGSGGRTPYGGPCASASECFAAAGATPLCAAGGPGYCTSTCPCEASAVCTIGGLCALLCGGLQSCAGGNACVAVAMADGGTANVCVPRFEADAGDLCGTGCVIDTIVTEEPDLTGITVGPNNTLYWSASLPDGGSAIRQMPLPSGAKSTAFELGAIRPGQLAGSSTSTRLLWTRPDQNDIVSWSPPLLSLSTFAIGDASMAGLAYDPDHDVVYWSDASGLHQMQFGQGATPLALRFPGAVQGLSLNKDWLSYTQPNATEFNVISVFVGITPTVGPPAGSSTNPFGVVATDEGVYWTDITEGQVKFVSSGTGETLNVARGLDRPAEMTTDGTSVYWVARGLAGGSQNSGTIMRFQRCCH